MQVENCRFQDLHWGTKRRLTQRSAHENLGICNFLPALRIRAISTDRDL